MLRHLCDGDRSSQLARRCLPGDQPLHRVDHRHDLRGRQPHTKTQRGSEADRDPHQRRIRVGADHPEVLAAGVRRFRRDRHSPQTISAQHRQHEWLSRAFTNATHHVAPGNNGVRPDPHDDIATPQPSLLGRLAEIHRSDASGIQLHDRTYELIARRGVSRDVHDDWLGAPRDCELEPFGTLDHLLRELVPGLQGVAVDMGDEIATMHGGERLRARWQAHRLNRVHRSHRGTRSACDRDESGEDDECQEQIHRDAGENDGHAGPQGFLVEGPSRIDRHRGFAAFQLANHAFVFQARHLHVPTERDP